MPSKNAIKEYESQAYYHIYNRGVAKRTIFKDAKDYKTFLSYLQFYLTDPDLRGDSSQGQFPPPPSKKLKNYNKEVELIAYCLMPNHFHLFVRQYSDTAINYFMRSLCTKYVRYFNTRYSRVGHLFQDTYKAVKVKNEEQWVYLSKYIHRNPLNLPPCEETPRRLLEYKYSSYPNYLGMFSQNWLHPEEILGHFHNDRQSYQKFVEERDDVTPLYSVAIDYD